MKAVRHETNAYRLETERNGLFITLTRKADNKSAFFMGDDSALWLRNMDAIEECARSPYNPPHAWSLDKSFDYLCSGYDDILHD